VVAVTKEIEANAEGLPAPSRESYGEIETLRQDMSEAIEILLSGQR
jgi:hypothetical protein